jgi:hypothetical protein
MADELAKGLGIFTTAGLGWMVLAGWYNTTEDAQLTGAPPEDLGTYAEMALVLKEVLFWFAILGTLTFILVIPAYREARTYLSTAE